MSFLKLLHRKQRDKEAVVNCGDAFEASKMVDVVTGYMNAINDHAGVDELLSFYTSNKVKIKFEDGLKVSAQTSCEFYQTLYACFPDVRWDYKAVKEFSKNCVLVEDARAFGTHTGEPFRLKGHPEIMAAGKRFENDPALFYFTIADNKIDEVVVVALGLKTGPLGIYEDLSRPE